MFWEGTRQPVERGSECRVHVYVPSTMVLSIPKKGTIWYHGTCTMVLEYGTIWYSSTYVCTSILSQKQLEIQALRCNGDTIVGVVSIEGITVYYS